MRRSSIITLLLLVLVIIGLVVALVVTNIPKKEVEENVDNKEQVVENIENEKEEKPNYISLDSQIVKDMKNVLNTSQAFYAYKTEPITEKNIGDYDKQYIAYRLLNLEEKFGETEKVGSQNWVGGTMPKSEMDKAIKQIFGDDATYTPGDFGYEVSPKTATYEEDKQQYRHVVGLGGGGPGKHGIAGITKVEEYSDRYEVTEKYIFIVPDIDTNSYEVYAWNSLLSTKLGEYGEEYATIDLPTIDELTAESENHQIYLLDNSSEDGKKLLNKFYNQASEYKHTFMKREDGTIYWVKTDLIK